MNFHEVSKFRLPQKTDQQCSAIFSHFLLNSKCNIMELGTGLIPLHGKYIENKEEVKNTKERKSSVKIDSLEIFEREFAKITSGKCITCKS